MEINSDDIKPFEEKVIMSGMCDFTVPTTISALGNKKQVIYNFEGYTALRDMTFVGVKILFEILEKTFVAFKRAGEFLIDPAKVTLTCDTVFYNKKQRDVKIAYIPVGRPKYVVMGSVTSLLDELTERLDGDAVKYLVMTKGDIEKDNYTLEDTIEYIKALRRELAVCGIK